MNDQLFLADVVGVLGHRARSAIAVTFGLLSRYLLTVTSRAVHSPGRAVCGQKISEEHIMSPCSLTAMSLAALAGAAMLTVSIGPVTAVTIRMREIDLA